MWDMVRSWFSLDHSHPETDELAFWKWFAQNEAAYRTFEVQGPEQDRLVAELDRRLKKVHKGICWQFDDGKGEQRELVLSADGVRDLIPVVEGLVEVAPPILKGWKIVKFRQRLSNVEDIALEAGDEKVAASDMWFALTPEGGHIHIDLYLPGTKNRPKKANYTIAFLMLDIALGEYDVMTRMGEVECHPVPADPEAHGLKPFRDLPAEFDALYALMNGS